MGMDIYGLNPMIKGVKPEIEWDNSTRVQKNDYRTSMAEFEQENLGYYFRANVWSWRPIAQVILESATMYKLSLPVDFIDNIHVNSGAGLKTQQECTILANIIDEYIAVKFEGWNSIGLNIGWYTQQTITKSGSLSNVTIEPVLSNKLEVSLYPEIFVKDGVFEVDGFMYNTAHCCGLTCLQDFVNFLRECGGFEIR